MHGVLNGSNLKGLVAAAGVIQQLVKALYKPTAQTGMFHNAQDSDGVSSCVRPCRGLNREGLFFVAIHRQYKSWHATQQQRMYLQSLGMTRALESCIAQLLLKVQRLRGINCTCIADWVASSA